MKSGDKILCKKTYTLNIIGNNTILLYSGKEYVIDYVIDNGNGYSIICEYEYRLLCYDNIKTYDIYIWDYFYTQEELRKMKLKSL